jgi:sigma-B regulation protein RsbU (phosphoserine phosphatase)
MKSPAAIRSTVPAKVAESAAVKIIEKEQAQLAAIIEYSNDAIISKTVDGIIIGWNHGAEREYGYSAEEIIGRNISVLFPPDHHQEYLQILRKVESGEAVPAFDTVRDAKMAHSSTSW